MMRQASAWPSNFTFDRTSGSHSLARAGQRERYLDSDQTGRATLPSYTGCPEGQSP
jgi:hypothetical protein